MPPIEVARCRPFTWCGVTGLEAAVGRGARRSSTHCQLSYRTHHHLAPDGPGHRARGRPAWTCQTARKVKGRRFGPALTSPSAQGRPSQQALSYLTPSAQPRNLASAGHGQRRSCHEPTYQPCRRSLLRESAAPPARAAGQPAKSRRPPLPPARGRRAATRCLPVSCRIDSPRPSVPPDLVEQLQPRPPCL